MFVYRNTHISNRRGMRYSRKKRFWFVSYVQKQRPLEERNYLSRHYPMPTSFICSKCSVQEKKKQNIMEYILLTQCCLNLHKTCYLTIDMTPLYYFLQRMPVYSSYMYEICSYTRVLYVINLTLLMQQSCFKPCLNICLMIRSNDMNKPLDLYAIRKGIFFLFFI